ncbi:MAG: PaaI family thioesterase [Thermoanaerobaculia bacterium]
MTPDEVEVVLARWRAEEAAVRARLAPPGSARPDQIRGRSGLQIFEAIFAGELPRPAIGDTLDIFAIRMEAGRAVFQGRPQAKHYNPLGIVHGGWFATLLDSAMGCAVQSALPANRIYTTVELSLNIVRSLTEAVPLVRGEGEAIHVGRQLATAEGRIVGPDGKLYAHGTTTCFVFDRARAPEG